MSRADSINEIMFCFINFRKGIVRNKPGHVHGLPPAQAEALFCIWHDKKITVSNLAQSLTVTPGAATQLVEALVRLGLVEREADPTDKRVTKLRLSPAGQKNVRTMKQHKLVKITQVLSVLDDQELKTLTMLLKKVSQSVQNRERKS